MGICAECIYLGEKKPSPDRCRRFSENYICNNLENAEIDFVTGATILSSCRVKNQFGECLFFDDGKIDVHYFAWTDGENVIYTKTESPEVDDKYLTPDLEEAGSIESVKPAFAWLNEEVVYTATEEPEVNFDLFSSHNELLGQIEAIEADKLTFRDIEYTRNSDFDTVFIDDMYRTPEDDIVRREDPPEEEPDSSIDESEIPKELPDPEVNP